MVLGGRAQHGGAADVDVLDALFEGGAVAGNRVEEGIEIAGDEVDGANTVLLERFGVGGQVTPGQDAAMDGRVERLDAAIEHLGR